MHPIIQRQLPPEPRIAELATGPGAWLLDLSKQLPPASQLDGYDISNDAFLQRKQLPSNVTLSVSDAKGPAPPKHHGKYDAVYIRFINVAMAPEDWKKVTDHAAQLLKPGGAINWIEGDLLQLMTVYRSAPETKTAASKKAFRRALSKLGQLRWFIHNLENVLVQAGFADVQHTIASTDRLPEDRKATSGTCVGAIHSILLRQAHSKADGMPTLEEVEEWRKEMLDEVEGGAYSRTDMHQFVAFKAGQVK